jgi:chromate transporter
VSILISLSLWFSLMSLMAVGGGAAVLPEMQHVMLREFNMTTMQFVHIYGLGQLVPGPNMLAVLVMGQVVAGFAGALVVGLAFFLPSSIATFFAGRVWDRVGDIPWRRTLQKALEPISIGLMCSGVYSIGKAALINWQTSIAALTVFILLLKTKINPLILIAVCAVLAVLFL